MISFCKGILCLVLSLLGPGVFKSIYHWIRTAREMIPIVETLKRRANRRIFLNRLNFAVFFFRRRVINPVVVWQRTLKFSRKISNEDVSHAFRMCKFKVVG